MVKLSFFVDGDFRTEKPRDNPSFTDQSKEQGYLVFGFGSLLHHTKRDFHKYLCSVLLSLLYKDGPCTPHHSSSSPPPLLLILPSFSLVLSDTTDNQVLKHLKALALSTVIL